jgi:transposase
MSQNNISLFYAGLDVAKESLALHFQGRAYCLTNNAKGCARLLSIVGKSPNVQVIVEATGGYEQTAVRTLHAAGIAVSVLLPSRVRAYAKAKGLLAKTDPIDAALLAEFGKAVCPPSTQPPTDAQLCLRELVTRRRQLLETITAESNRSAHYLCALARKQAAAALKFLEKQAVQCEKAISQLIAENEEFSSRSSRVQEVPGVGLITAATLLAEMPELGSLSDESAAALLGVAPYNCDSGPWKGTRRIRGGRASLRCVLYMATHSAVKHDPIFKSFYLRLRERGKPPLVALTAVMRKLIILLNRMLKDPSWKLAHSASI